MSAPRGWVPTTVLLHLKTPLEYPGYVSKDADIWRQWSPVSLHKAYLLEPKEDTSHHPPY